jgi:putative membrane protein
MFLLKQSALATLLAVAIVGAAHAQAPSPTARGSGADAAPPASADGSLGRRKPSSEPATFVKKAAQAGLTEVALAKQASSQAQDPKVKQFAEHMVQDHSNANDQLTSIARQKGLEVPSSLDAEHEAIVKKMSSKSGAAFDAAYSKQMVTDHKKAVALFEGASKSSDSDLAAFAQKTLPTLKEHEQMAHELPGVMHSASATDSARQKQ